MPAIYLFNRRTPLGGDDLQIPSLLTVLVRLFQSIFLILPILIHLLLEAAAVGSWSTYFLYDPNQSSITCRHTHLFPLLLLVYTLSSALYCAMSSFVEWKLIRKSSLGTPTQPELRRDAVRSLLEIKLIPLAVINVLVLICGLWAITYARRYYHCREKAAAAASSSSSSVGRGGGYNNLDGGLFANRGSDWPWEQPGTGVREGWWLRGDSGGSGESDADMGDDDDYDYESLVDVPNLLGKNAWWAAYLLLLLSQLAEAGVSLLAVITLFGTKPTSRAVEEMSSSSSSSSYASAHDPASIILMHPHQHHELVERMWHDRCSSFCHCLSVTTCFLFGGRNIETGDYGTVARALADFFESGDVLDLVPSDIAIGFVALRRVQRERILRARRLVLQETMVAEDVDSTVSREKRAQSSSSLTGMIQNSARDTTLLESDHCHPLSAAADWGAAASMLHPSILLPSDMETHPRDALLLTPSSESGGRLTGGTAVAFRMQQDGSARFYEPKSRKVLSRNNEFDRSVIAEGARFVRHALAIYTWVLYVYMHPLSGGCRLLFGRKRKGSPCRSPNCCFSSTASSPFGSFDSFDNSQTPVGRRRVHGGDDEVRCLNGDTDDERGERGIGQGSGRLIGDNCCHTHKSALLLHAGLHDSDLLYAQLNSSFTETPYCIVLDHKWQSVVVAIRGTLSLEDCVTDVLFDPEPLDELGRDFGFDSQEQRCHGGVLNCIRFIYNDLQRHKILERMLLGDNALYPEYTLRIVGHSLGAGCAIILAYMLRQTHPTLRCLCYSPPGGLLSWRLAIGCKEFCTSFVLDSDLVPRLSIETMELLRNEVLELIGRIKVPKSEVARQAVHHSGLFSCRTCRDDEFADNDVDLLAESNAELLRPRDELPPDTEFARQLEQFQAIQRQRKMRRGGGPVSLFPPGRIVHLVKTGERKSCRHGLAKCLTCCTSNAGSEYTPVWAENDDFNEIVISPTMGTDHFPNRVCLEIEGVAKVFGLDISLGSSDSDRDGLAIV